MASQRPPASLPLAMLVALVLGAGVGWSAAGDAPRGVRVAQSEATLEREVLALVNRHRVARDLPALAPDPRIGREARRHSAAMASGATPFGHEGFVARVAALRRTMSCRSSAENVASSLGHEAPAREVLRGWLASSGHRRNIEGPYDTTGIGVARSPGGKLYFTQIFVGR